MDPFDPLARSAHHAWSCRCDILLVNAIQSEHFLPVGYHAQPRTKCDVHRVEGVVARVNEWVNGGYWTGHFSTRSIAGASLIRHGHDTPVIVLLDQRDHEFLVEDD